MGLERKRIIFLFAVIALLFIAGCSKAAKEKPAPSQNTAGGTSAESAPSSNPIDVIGEGVAESSGEDVNISELDNLAGNLDEIDW